MGLQNIATTAPRVVAAHGQSSLTSRKRHGVAVNAVAEFLRRHLEVPEIYLQPKMGLPIDILAVNAAGSGDFHGVEIKVPNNFVTSTTNLISYVRQLRSLPLHFKWLALPDAIAVKKIASHPMLFDASGIGRIGILLLTENGDELPQITVLTQAQRFKISRDELTQAEGYIKKHKPDIEVRI